MSKSADRYLQQTLDAYYELREWGLVNIKNINECLSLEVAPVDDKKIMIPNEAYLVIRLAAQLFLHGNELRVMIESRKKLGIKLFGENISLPEPKSSSYERKKKAVNTIIDKLPKKYFHDLAYALCYEPQNGYSSDFYVAVVPGEVYVALNVAATISLLILELGAPPMIFS